MSIPRLPAILLGLALACAIFAWWGTSTVQGRQQFDEMRE